jgi:putative ABC transport system ATP-binding protein
MRHVLEIEGLDKTFVDGQSRRIVIQNLTLALGPGEVVAVQGPSGSGKSTLLNIVAGLVPADAGRMTLSLPDGALALHTLDVNGMTLVRRRHFGYVFQFFNLVPTLTVEENVRLPLELNGRADLLPRALERLADLGLSGRFGDYPDTLSGGEQQRVAIARALAHEPVLILADEPTGNLDATNAGAVADLLWREVRRLNSALLVATHDDAIAARADRVQRIGVAPAG